MLAMLGVATVVRWIGWAAGDGDFWLWPALYALGVISLALAPIVAKHLQNRLRRGGAAS